MPPPSHNHKIITGDCLTDWPNRKARLIVTDPPYGVGYRRAGGAQGGPGNKSTTVLDWAPISNDQTPFLDWLPIAFDRLEDGGALYLCTRWDVEPIWRQALVEAGFKVKQRLTWHKRVHGKGDLKGTWATTCEDVLFATKGRHILNSRPSMLLDVGCVPTWEMRYHPHQKPEPLMELLISTSSAPGDLVVDPFVGSGTTAVVAKRLGRRFLGIELDPTYAGLARKRMDGFESPPPPVARITV